MSAQGFNYQGIWIATDREGYLLDKDQWHDDLAVYMASQSGLCLTEAHWAVILFARKFYSEFNLSPGIRVLIKALQQDFPPETMTSRYLAALFKEGPAKQISRLAGLPKPASCL